MTVTKSDELVQDYLHRLEIALRPLPLSRRDQLVSEIAEHITQGRAAVQGQSEDAVRQLLERLGEPEDIATAALSDETIDRGPAVLTRRVLIPLGVFILLAVAVTSAGLLGAFTSGGGGSPHKPLTTNTASTATTRATVPNVIGLPAAVAIDTVKKAGFSGIVTPGSSNSFPRGTIFSESPAGGTE